jgi:hypothetical protein
MYYNEIELSLRRILELFKVLDKYNVVIINTLTK